MPLTAEAIARIRTLTQSGKLPPGSKLPPEPRLAAELGISRSPMREAVKALAVTWVLDVRHGDGPTSPASPRPSCSKGSDWPSNSCRTTRCWSSPRQAGCSSRSPPASPPPR
ncbi:FadR/GntR family transcriptional regulator [Amycolatopsis sp. NPDC058278]|uniref:FadR/GntR family transcriptional regulator n=1 Tax=Amycolatopsis sp. NPDC058278 TaxID=3346417 RepID=UPI0036DE61F6